MKGHTLILTEDVGIVSVEDSSIGHEGFTFTLAILRKPSGKFDVIVAKEDPNSDVVQERVVRFK